MHRPERYSSNIHGQLSNTSNKKQEDDRIQSKKRKIDKQEIEQFGLAFGVAWNTFRQCSS